MRGSARWLSRCANNSPRTADIVGIDDTVTEPAPKLLLQVLQSKAVLLGVAPRDIVDVIGVALSGQDVTSLHDADAKYAPPLRIGSACRNAQPHR